jgi:hypothetical protein
MTCVSLFLTWYLVTWAGPVPQRPVLVSAFPTASACQAALLDWHGGPWTLAGR